MRSAQRTPERPAQPDWLNAPLDEAALNELLNAWTRYNVRLTLHERRSTWWFAVGFVAALVLAFLGAHSLNPWTLVPFLILVLAFAGFTLSTLPRLLMAQRVLHTLQPLDGPDQAALDWLLTDRPEAARLRDHLHRHPRAGRHGELEALKALRGPHDGTGAPAPSPIPRRAS